MQHVNPPSLLSVTVLSENADRYHQLLQDTTGSVSVTLATTDPAAITPSEVTVLLADPDLAASIIPDCEQLLWCQSTWAGNAPLLKLAKKDYKLTGVKGVFGEQMREYVFAYILYYSRQIAEFQRLQQSGKGPHWDPPTLSGLEGKTLGVMGAGSIAMAMAPAARLFGMRLIGLTRSGKPVDGFAKIFTPDQKYEFASECDFLVNLLPDTAATVNFIDTALLAAVPLQCVLINAGRGSAIDDVALLNALDEERLYGAVLDVFRQEPLPREHPFWYHPKVHVTQHTAAKSYPEDIAKIFLKNAQRFLAGQPLLYQFEFNRGY